MVDERADLLAVLGPLVKSLRRLEDAAAEAAGVTMWQYAILAIVAADSSLNQGDVAARLAYSPNRIIADLDTLEQKGLLRRIPGPDRRANLVRASPAGVQLMRGVRADIHRREHDLLVALPADQRGLLLEAAGAMTTILTE